MAITTSFVAGQTYYAIYYKTLTNYYYNNNSYTNRNLYRNEYLANSNDTNYSSVIATNNAIKVNYTTAGGPGGSEWFGLSNDQDTTPEYSTVAQAATSCDTTLYTVYKFNVNYSAGANVSSVGSSTGSCNITTSSTSCNVTLPSITPNSGYTSAGWSTTSGATTGTEAGQNYSLNSNNISDNTQSILEDNKEIALTTLEYDLVLFLIENKNKSFSREEILKNVWGTDYFGNDRVVDDLIRRVRNKLPKLNINTLYGFGYRLS